MDFPIDVNQFSIDGNPWKIDSHLWDPWKIGSHRWKSMGAQPGLRVCPNNKGQLSTQTARHRVFTALTPRNYDYPWRQVISSEQPKFTVQSFKVVTLPGKSFSFEGQSVM